MDRMGTTFAGYRLHRIIMRAPLLTLYQATWPNGDHIAHAGRAADAPRPVALWISSQLDRVSSA
jgi:hypothetical protein